VPLATTVCPALLPPCGEKILKNELYIFEIYKIGIGVDIQN